MAHASQVFVFISGSCIDKYTHSGKMPWQGFCRNSDAIRQGGYLVKLCWILYLISIARHFWADLKANLLYWFNNSCQSSGAKRRRHAGEYCWPLWKCAGQRPGRRTFQHDEGTCCVGMEWVVSCEGRRNWVEVSVSSVVWLPCLLDKLCTQNMASPRLIQLRLGCCRTVSLLSFGRLAHAAESHLNLVLNCPPVLVYMQD